MEKFYSHDLKCMVQQICKRTARKLFNEGKDIYFLSSKMRFDNVWMPPMCAQKDGFSFSDYSFDQICNFYEIYNCDNYRGRYTHFFVKADQYEKTLRVRKLFSKYDYYLKYENYEKDFCFFDWYAYFAAFRGYYPDKGILDQCFIFDWNFSYYIDRKRQRQTILERIFFLSQDFLSISKGVR